jgi:hypothetical protein
MRDCISISALWVEAYNTEEWSGLNSAIGDFILADKTARTVGNILREISVYGLNVEKFEHLVSSEESVKRTSKRSKQVE